MGVVKLNGRLDDSFARKGDNQLCDVVVEEVRQRVDLWFLECGNSDTSTHTCRIF